ncbi:class I SAM-dependent methyltransferase [Mycolicibacterium hippocampi]|uniref:Putative O-methyltransferase Omt n=1 Tax=Mycolicibacterium hippocampi TaxID=659824 RepID=A0A7I9ZLZ8_9MYCO|nr:class I SAM-dependent methyltransferase [Mycolicibacterium hippocampi]GFH01849.1 putative O-methyltransferase Omt [Mycolicibacterium hippocampi]
MTATLDDLTPVEKTLLVTLAGRALDARKPRPLLNDQLAADVCDRLGPIGDTVRPSGTVQLATAIRSRMLDRLVTAFIDAHPDAVVVELGCGLETRMHRITPPTTVDWYDLDLDRVIALRRQMIPALERAHPVAASLTEPGWLQDIPRERPVIVVADGVLGFLTEADNRQILNALTEHFTAGGELAFVAYTRVVARLMGSIGELRRVGIPKGFRGFGFDDAHDVERLNPRLTFIEEQLGAAAPEAAHFPWATRMVAKLFARWRAQGRRGVWIVRYRF